MHCCRTLTFASARFSCITVMIVVCQNNVNAVTSCVLLSVQCNAWHWTDHCLSVHSSICACVHLFYYWITCSITVLALSIFIRFTPNLEGSPPIISEGLVLSRCDISYCYCTCLLIDFWFTWFSPFVHNSVYILDQFLPNLKQGYLSIF